MTAREEYGTCEGCGVKIYEGDLHHYCSDSIYLCDKCAPMLSDCVKQMDEYLAKPDGWMAYEFLDSQEDLQAQRDQIAADISENGDRKAVSK